MESETIIGTAAHGLQAGDMVYLDYGRIKWYKKLFRFITFGLFKPKPIVCRVEEITDTSFTINND